MMTVLDVRATECGRKSAGETSMNELTFLLFTQYLYSFHFLIVGLDVTRKIYQDLVVEF